MAGALVFGTATGVKRFVGSPHEGDGAPASRGNSGHVALLARTRAAVNAFYAAALAAGGTDAGGPELRPHCHPTYYAAYARDPDGNKLQTVCHTAPA